MSEYQQSSSLKKIGPEQLYFQFLAEGRWKVPSCRGCKKVVFYPRNTCPACRHDEFDWIAPSGSGTVHSTTVMRRPSQAGGDLNLCIVDLDEGFRMMSRVDNLPPEQVRIGARVSAALSYEEGQVIVVFNVAKESA